MRKHPAQWLDRYPLLIGFGLSVAIATAILVMVTWFPAAEGVLERHGAILTGVFLTILFFAAYLCAFWQQRHRRGFWHVMVLILACHIVGLWLYSVRVHPPFLLQWSILGFSEAWVIGGSLAWLARGGS